MPQHERGLYEPGEDVRAFDGPEDDEDVGGSRLPLLIVLALLVLAMFAGFVWLAYSEGVARGRGETPVITAEAGPARIAPQNAGGAAEPYKGFKIYEQPAPPDDDTAQSAAPAQNPASPPPATKPALTEPTSAPVAPMKAAAPAPAPAAPVKVAAAPPKPVPAMKPSQLPAQPAAPIGPATAPPRALNTAPAAPVTAKPAPAAAPAASAPAASGSFVLQIGAYKSQADANTAWTTYKTKHASLLSGYSPDVRQADLGEKGTWYRLRITGFPSKDVASALCDRLKADGGGCFLGK
jgi:hypothetical protein